jgi:hypothetical protein
MPTGRTNNATHSGSRTNRPLPELLAASLAPESRLALMHGVRRRILRMLNQAPTPQATADLVGKFPGLSLSSFNYHVLVLDQCGILTASRGKATPGGFVRLLISNVVEDPQLVAVLRATESLDDVR